MVKVAGVQFISGLKVYDFKMLDDVKIRDYVLVETVQGEEIGKVVYINKEFEEKDLRSPLKEIKKILTEEDRHNLKEYRKKGQEIMPQFVEKIEKYGLKMSPVMLDYSLDGETIILYFTADGRVDFRSLVRDLARTFRKQVKLRQVGSRDEAKIYGGFGMCGRPICCRSFIVSTESITMDMARGQYKSGISANKVSGLCGRLMCCLSFEPGNKKKK
ncbi:stage 0 sporulation protein [bacterium (Candidatus Howlettbacteria) CG_4_10_14_0_8_um_filter_40_9]|nr:MAG: stage 0 sporulation protein [bacterium (Candidatus Howlettbacteria) CG_4_10_14_0_8_um_filter_40_9]